MSVNDYDQDLYDCIQELGLDEKSAPYGIAMQVVHQGYSSLSPKQRFVYETEVIPLLKEQAEENEQNARFDPN